jgi:chloramphenicol-sensitive protein RarD
MGAFLIWGALPLYLRPLLGIPALTILAHRLVWCCLLVSLWLAARRDLGSVRAALANPSTRRGLIGSAALIGFNWLVYILAIGTGHVVDSSLGYFINPLVNVLLGVALLGERPNRVQWVAVACAALGVAWLTVQAGRLPWIALALAFSFGGYGLIRKVIAVDALTGLAAETALLTPLGLAWLAWQGLQGVGVFGGADALRIAWLIVGGLITATPLALFAYGARRLPYSTIGIVQYLAPSLQLVFGVFVFGEAFSSARAKGFGLIWMALVIYGADGLWRARRVRVAGIPEPRT